MELSTVNITCTVIVLLAGNYIVYHTVSRGSGDVTVLGFVAWLFGVVGVILMCELGVALLIVSAGVGVLMLCLEHGENVLFNIRPKHKHINLSKPKLKHVGHLLPRKEIR